MRNEIKDLKIHAYLDVTVVYGRKPGGKPTSDGKLPLTATSSGFVGGNGGVVGSGIPVEYQGLD
jgi:hypothetical protein